MWRPPAKRSIEATSALRQQVLVICVLASSDFTCAVIAMSRSSHARQQPFETRNGPRRKGLSAGVAEDLGVCRGELDRVVARGPGCLGDVLDDQPGAERRDHLL